MAIQGVDKVLDFFVVGASLAVKVKSVMVIEEYGSISHKLVMREISWVKAWKWQREKKVLDKLHGCIRVFFSSQAQHCVCLVLKPARLMLSSETLDTLPERFKQADCMRLITC